ncbi:MAG: hypothetical protein Tsb009_32580 [Planctomycetaceae bacterium]
MVHVPSIASVLAARVPEKEKEAVGTYGIVASEPAVPRYIEERKKQRTTHEHVDLVCPHCSARLSPEVREKLSHITCPDCLEVIDVPSRDDAKSSRYRKRKKRRPKNPGRYSVANHDESSNSGTRRDPLETGYQAAHADIRSEPPPPIPNWTFFTQVFNFPWRKDTIARWVLISLGLAAAKATLMIAIALWFSGMVIAIPFFALPMIWLTLLTVSYTAACWSTVVEQTAAGNDEIREWPDPNWREWFAQMFYVGFVTSVASILPWAVGVMMVPLAGAVGFWGVFAGVLFFVWPVVMLSSMEAASPWVPLTRPILASIAKFWWGWLVYYGLSGLLAAAYVGLLMLFEGGNFFGFYGNVAVLRLVLFVLLSSVILSSIILIHARLLGRLAWKGIVFQEGEGDGDEKDDD